MDLDILWTVWTGAKGWQGLIGNVVGFVGVIVTLLFTARKDRDLHRRREETDRRLTAEKERVERRGFLVAIRAELNNYLNELESMAKPLGEDGSMVHFVPPKLYEPLVYRANITKIMLVSEASAQAIIKAYQMIPSYDQDIAYLIEGLRRHIKVEQMGDGFYVLPSDLPMLASVKRKATLPIVFALQAIERELQASGKKE